MFKFRKIIVILSMIGGLLLNVAYAAPALTAMQTVSNPQKSIVVEKNSPQFSITLASNPTTGYSWLVNGYDSNLIQITSHHFTQSSGNRMGAGGFETWVFTIKPAAFTAPQITTVSFTYARPWEVNNNAHKVMFTIVTH